MNYFTIISFLGPALASFVRKCMQRYQSPFILSFWAAARVEGIADIVQKKSREEEESLSCKTSFFLQGL